VSPSDPRRLRVVQAVTSDGWGGRERVPLLLARELIRAGHLAEVWTDPRTPTYREALRWGLPVRPLPFKGYLSPRVWARTAAFLGDFLPDLIHAHAGRDLWAIVPALAWARCRAPLLLSQHVGNARPKKDPLHRLLYGRVDRVLACSEVIRRNVQATCPVDPGRCLTAYAPTDLGIFRFDPKTRAAHRKKWGLPPSHTAVGFAARLSEGKGHLLAIRTVEALKRRFPNLRLFLAGGPTPGEESYVDLLKGEVGSLGLGQRVRFTGYLESPSDVAGFLSALDVVLHPAGAEAFGMAVVEAMACGRPVVVRDGEGAAEIVRGADGRLRGGLLVAGGEPADWAEALGRLLKNRGLRSRLSREAPAVARRFSLERFVRFHLELYRKLTAGS
jgi:glycosyltransferase involved in cell wall biosynthesis